VIEMVNREAAPLIVGVSIPLILLALLFIQLNQFDMLTIFLSIDMIYYIVLFPIFLGLIFAILYRSKE
jgi:hypothetical protein